MFETLDPLELVLVGIIAVILIYVILRVVTRILKAPTRDKSQHPPE